MSWGIWTPKSNKYVTELTVQLEASKFSKRRAEYDLEATEVQIQSTQKEINKIVNQIRHLKKEALVVDMREYKDLQFLFNRVNHERIVLGNNRVTFTNAIKQYSMEIANLEAKIEKAKSRVLGFKT